MEQNNSRRLVNGKRMVIRYSFCLQMAYSLSHASVYILIVLVERSS